MLMLGLVAAGATIALWRRPQTTESPVIVIASPLPGNADRLAKQSSGAPDDEKAGDTPRPVGSSGSPRTSAELATRLISEIEAAFASTDIDRLDLAITELVPALVQADAPAAARWAEAIADAGLRAEVLHLVAQLWAARDSASALAWAANLKTEEDRETALTDVCVQVAAVDPAKALQLRARHVREGEPSSALDDFAHQWAEKDFLPALAWILAHSHGAQRDALLAQLAFVKALNAPFDAAALVANEVQPGEVQNEAVISVVHQWAQRDLTAATSWVGQFPDGPLRERAILELTGIAQYRQSAITR